MLKARLFCIAVLLAITGLASVRPATAQRQPQAAAVLPSNEELDALLAARKWDELGAALSGATGGEPFARMMDWLQAKINVGGGFFLVFRYANDLWNAGNAAKVQDPNKDMRMTAAFMTLYAYELVVIDGAKCADGSAAGPRLDQLLMYDAPILKYLATKPAKLKTKTVDLAVAFEKHTAPLRKDDDVLCRGGLGELMAGFEGGTTTEAPPQPGQPGQSFEVTAPPGYAPQFVTPQEYMPLQKKARLELRAELLGMVSK